jgi:hypothetical protein
MTTLAELAARALNAMGDGGGVTWSSAQVEEWLREGLADYGQYFPRQLVTELTTEAGVRCYPLPEALQAILLVEYPAPSETSGQAGSEPPQYLALRSRARRDFWGRTGFYDWRAAGEAGATPELALSEAPLAGETIAVTYLAPPETTLESGDAVGAPAGHLPVLILYAVMMAWQERLAQEERAPTSNSTLLLSQFASNADRARRNYVQALARARIAASGRSGVVRWGMDKWEGS